ncbi:MAG TPA: glycosyltransferase family 4 protein [Pyrinomonadaceae bacterium]|nr:glycosyltransferase family 4 protein [Pyrinomonadaceae bacterium]
MKVLGLASYPVEAAATRYRLQQFARPLAERGIDLTIHPFMSSALFAQFYRKDALASTAFGLIKSSLMRLTDVVAANRFDIVMIQREAMLLGPPVIEWMITRALKRPLVLDLDDATYVSYTSPTYGRISKTLKWFSKTDDLIRWARVVTCGNRAIAEYVSSKGAKARVIPTVVDTEIFRPLENRSEHAPVLGWIGTHSTFPYLESIFPVLQDLSKSYDFRLRIVGAGRTEVSVPGVMVDNLHWSLEREVADFQSIDIGLYPIDASLYSGNWAAGKSGFKALQYMAVGIPYVATPVGASAEIGIEGTTHFCARTNEEWHDALSVLLRDTETRKRMGAAGRAHVIENYGLPAQADKLAAALREALSN